MKLPQAAGHPRGPLPFEQLAKPGRITIGGAPGGYDALVIARVAQALNRPVIVVAEDDARMAQLADTLAFFVPDLERYEFPAWDCLPYDRVSPGSELVGRRIDALSRLATSAPARGIVLTTVSAVLQRVPPPEDIARRAITVRTGDQRAPDAFSEALVWLGYQRVDTVADRGEFAVRGGILDVFPPRSAEALRFDFFGDEIEGIRAFDAATQRTTGRIETCTLLPISETLLDEDAITRFRSGYRALAGADVTSDPLYAAVSTGQRYQGMEHWLPLFYDRLATLFDYLPEAPVILDGHAEAVRERRLELIDDYYTARREIGAGRFADVGFSYIPVPPARLFLSAEEWEALSRDRCVATLDAYVPDAAASTAVDAGGRVGIDFTADRQRSDVNVFDALGERIAEHHRHGRRVLIAAVTTGSRDRMITVLRDHQLPGLKPAAGWREAETLSPRTVGIVIVPLDRGFTTDDLAVITEQDILGERMVRRAARRARPEAFLLEASSLSPGDLVVHIDHGIGRYDALEAVAVDGAPHDCLRILYADGDRLYLPVENIEMISRFGSESDGVALDRLGGAAWQARKARMKERLKDMADELIRLAAAREVHEAPQIAPAEGAFEEFCARFPYTETDDQARAIADVLDDLGRGKPADRLICGDVGFGKTEVALRAAFVTALDGRQVAVVVPTTLLCRQHFRTFNERFRGFPVRVAEISRLVSAKDVKAAKAGIADGTIDIVVGTHALLARDVSFRDLGLLIVDEEQHFGVAHKERLKKLKADVHVLTLSATPIPRTLQMALSGVREMSLIATPPVDRLAVRTFVLEYDPVVIREAILREHGRGGQTFYVCPRIEDLEEVRERLAKLVPEVTMIMAHGRMASRDLEAAVGAFYEGAYNVLLSTNIVESGLDLPAVNTIIIHRADMFGLSQLYQLRGRVGRGKLRAYAYLTLPPKKRVTKLAEKRLSVMQSLDALGAGFTVASHDLDIRGAGNLLGDEQSGHIREVGIELYQQMLEEAVAEARQDKSAAHAVHDWSPQISLGIGILIPESYVPDLSVRLGLYRRLGDLADRAAIDGFAAELIDRFGALPDEVNNLLEVVGIKQMCRAAGIERIEAGPKGAVVSFRGNAFANPTGLVGYISRRSMICKLRPDQRLVVRQKWETGGDRLAGVRSLVRDLLRVARGETVAAPPPPPPAPPVRPAAPPPPRRWPVRR